MSHSSVAFSGVATLVLAGAIFVAAPVLAQSSDPANSPSGPVQPAPAPVTSMLNANDLLVAASVQSQDGKLIGTIEKVIVGDDGAPRTVLVKMASTPDGDGRIVLIRARKLYYDSSNKIVLAALTQDEINSLPSTTAD